MERTQPGDRGAGTGQPITIVMYHSVSDLPGPYTVSPSMFRRQIEAIASSFRVIGLRSVPRELEARWSSERRVVLTFDDAFVDFAETAFPILEGLGLRSTVFCPASFVGRHNAWDEGLPGWRRRKVMDAAELRGLHATGLVEIGSHTLDHVRMGAVPEPEMRRQASGSRAALEDMLGCPVTSFAYPYGQLDDFSETSSRVIAEAGYRLAVTTHWGTLNAAADLFRLKRVSFEPDDGAAAVQRKVDGWYDWIGLKERAGSAARRIGRRLGRGGRRLDPA